MDLPVVIINNRILLDWGNETEAQQCCVHGIKLRWQCDECIETCEDRNDLNKGT